MPCTVGRGGGASASVAVEVMAGVDDTPVLT